MPRVTEEELYAVYERHPNVCIDSRKVQAGDLFFGLAGTQVKGSDFAERAVAGGAAFAVIDDPTFPLAGNRQYLVVDDTLAALQALARTHRRRHRMPVLAITGSNGKTTTKELVGAVMSRRYPVHATPGNYNNHLGLPLTILATPPDTEMTILEMGANHQGEIAELCRIGLPTHGLITNIGEAHLEGFGGPEGVKKGKGELFDYLRETGGVAFVNNDEDHLEELARNVSRTVHFATTPDLDPQRPAMDIRVRATHPRIHVEFLDEQQAVVKCELQLSGEHNLQNVKAAIAVGKYFKVPGREIAAGLAGYRSANHRSQELTHRGVRFYWDAYNANPSSVEAALAALANRQPPKETVVILGEMLELGTAGPAAHRRVALRAGQTAATVVLVGAQMEAVAREFNRQWFPNSETLKEWFYGQNWDGRTVFVKGSRGNQLERLLEE